MLFFETARVRRRAEQYIRQAMAQDTKRDSPGSLSCHYTGGNS